MNTIASSSIIIPEGDAPIVFSNTDSKVIGLPEHRVSIVFPKWFSQNHEEKFTTGPVIINATIKTLGFEYGDEVEKADKLTGFLIHEETFPVPTELKQLHEQGTTELKRFLASKTRKIRTVVGGDPLRKPRLSTLEWLDVVLDINYTAGASEVQKQCFEELFSEIEKMTSTGKVRLVPDSKIVIRVPRTLVLQNLTAIGKTMNSKPEIATPIIKYPVAFPELGSTVVINQRGKCIRYTIEDFEIVGNTRVEVLLVDPDDRTSSIYFPYSNLYAETEKDLYNPHIVKVISSSNYNKILREHHDTGRKIIQDSLLKWGLWKICVGKDGYKVMIRRHGEKTDSWVPWKDTLIAGDYDIMSFISGEITIKSESGNDQTYDLSIDHERCAVDDSVLFLQNLDAESLETGESVLNNLHFNAVIGNAECKSPHAKKDQAKLFFAATNGAEISFDSFPLFSMLPVDHKERPDIDVINDVWYLGIPGKSAEKKHADKVVLRWVKIDEQFKNFYHYVWSKGSNPLFKGKTTDQIRELVTSPQYPITEELFNFIIFGSSQSNPTLHEPWTQWFLEDVLGLRRDDF